MKNSTEAESSVSIVPIVIRYSAKTLSFCGFIYASHIYQDEYILAYLTFAVIKVVAALMLAYVLYWRVWDYFCAVRFYGSQGEQTCKLAPGHIPILGNASLLAWSAYKSYTEADNFFIMKHAFDFATKDTKSTAAFVSNSAGLGIKDVKIVEAMYTTKNKFFDKHPLTKDLAFCLTGDSILFAETTDDWKKSRKAITPAFYKGKLESLV